MPTGTGVDTLRNQPPTPFTMDPVTFAQLTNRQYARAFPSFADIGSAGGTMPQELPRHGIIGWLTLTFKGSVTAVDGTGGNTTKWNWPYGLLEQVEVRANGQNGLIVANGPDLHVRRMAANPAFEDNTDDFAGTVGGGNLLGALTADPLHLTWQVPISADRSSLVGALFAQSGQSTLECIIRQASDASLVTATGTATFAVSGTWHGSVDVFDVPRDPNTGALVVPDLSTFHGFSAFELPVSNTGETRLPLVRQNGQLGRLFLQVRNVGATTILDPKPVSQPSLTAVRLEYGAQEHPYDFSLIEELVARNNEWYGARLPYGYICLDFWRENAGRDAVLMQGLTDLRAVITIDSGVTLTSAKARIVQETLFA